MLIFRWGYVAIGLALGAAGTRAENSSALSAVKIENVEITSAVDVPEGTFQVRSQSGSQHAIPPAQVKAFCRVIGVVRPVAGSEIGFEVWLPKPAAWNKRLEGVCNGAYAGRISAMGRSRMR